MMVRIWRGEAATPENAEAYRRHVETTVFPSLSGLAGHRGAILLRREHGGRGEFLAITFWDSFDAIKGFSGEQVETAIVEPEARSVLSQFDEFAWHYEIACGKWPE